MIKRKATQYIQAALARQAAVVLLGPRQVGKTTLAHAIATDRPAIYLDLEASADRAKLTNPSIFLSQHEDKLVVLDEIHKMPEIFQELRGIIDSGRRSGHRNGRFLILGSAAIDLLKQSGESLAGRIEYVELSALNILETAKPLLDLNTLWLRGGFPDSFLAESDLDSFSLRSSFIRSYLERDIPMFGLRIPAETMERLWTMLAHNQGTLLNSSNLASSLGMSAPTISGYVGLLVDLLLMRRLPPFHINTKKRLVKSPKTYVRDSGLLHALLGIRNLSELLGHPIAGSSWEGFVIENLLSVTPSWAKPSFYRTTAGAEIDLVLDLGSAHGLWTIEVKRSLAPKIEKGLHNANTDLQPSKSFIVYPGQERYHLSAHIEAISLLEMAQILAGL